MKDKICYIVGAGEPSAFPLRPNYGDLVLAADGGLRWLEAQGLAPDFVIGDFDSLAGYPEHPRVIRLDPVKDETDLLAAVRFGQGRGYGHFAIYGGTGGRTDHTIANLQLLAMLAEQGQRGWLLGQKEIFTAVHNDRVSFLEVSRGPVSVFSVSEKSFGVRESGLKYRLDGYTMTNGFPIGVSNEFIGEPAEISVENGTLLIYYTAEARET